MIRPAKCTDIPAILTFLHAAGALSKYATRAHLDPTYAKQMLAQTIMRHEGRGESGTYCMVSETGDKVTGLLFAVKGRVLEICHELRATDLWFIVSRDAGSFDALAMFDGFVAWAKSDPRVIEITEAEHDALPGSTVAQIYERYGFAKIGSLYELGIERDAARSAA